MSTNGSTGSLAGKVAVITGASRGIGRALALAMAERGATIVGSARKLDSSDGTGGTLKSTIEAIQAAGGTGLAVPADITSAEGARGLIDRAVEAHGRVDVLVNNAGVFPYGAIAEFPPDEWDAMIAINLRAPFLLCQAAIPAMQRQGGGSILNMSSGAAVKYFVGRVAYAVSKDALNRLSVMLAEELRADNIAVNAYAPGLVATDMNDYEAAGVAPEALVESVMWILAQDVSFTGQFVRRDEFGNTWGPR